LKGDIEMMKIDMHIHGIMFVNDGEEKNSITRPGKDTFATAEYLRIVYKKLGIEKGVLLPIVSPEGQHRIISNEENYRMVCDNPDLFDWFCCIDPRWGNNRADTDLGYFIEHYKKLGAKGIGEVTCKLPFDNPLVKNMFYHAQNFNMPILFHIGAEREPYGLFDYAGLPLLEKTLEAYPDLKFIGHSASFWAEISGDCTDDNRAGYPKGPVVKGGRVPKLLLDYPNLYADISAGSGYNAITRDKDFGYSFLEEFQDKLFYGTDICAPKEYEFFKLADFLENGLSENKLSKTAYNKICRLNAESFLLSQS